MDWIIYFNIKVALGFLRKIKADPRILSCIDKAINRLENAMKLIELEERMRTEKMLDLMVKYPIKAYEKEFENQRRFMFESLKHSNN